MPRPQRWRHEGACAAALIAAAAAPAAGEVPPLAMRLLAPRQVLAEASGARLADAVVRHPWAVRDRLAEARAPEQGAVTRDGIAFALEVSSEALPEGVEASLFLGFFSFSYTAPEAMVEKWMTETNMPSPHNPVRMAAVFMSHFPGGRAISDDLGDACIGDAFRVDLCTRVWTCLKVVGTRGGGGARLRVATNVPFAANYRVEAYLGAPSSECVDPATLGHDIGSDFPWWAPPIAEQSVAAPPMGSHAAFLRFRLLYVDKVSWWWAHQARVEPAASWMEMMGAAIEGGTQLAKMGGPPGLWLEFGVGSGKTTAFIAARLRAALGDLGAILHGFDSFQGLPVSWEHTKLGVGTFTMYGKPPEHLQDMPNVKLHIGLFTDTLADLDAIGNDPVAFAHVDVDLYTSAVQVLSRIACQLVPGSILVFDELVNYQGFEQSGEYRAWEYVAAAYGISWDYAGLVWHQSVPVLVTGRGTAC